MGHAVPNPFHSTHRKRAAAPSEACKSQFITSPAPGTTLSFPGPTSLDIAWDSACLSSANIDIYLYAYSTSSTSRIHLWSGVPNAQGTYSAPVKPRWWNATAATTAQLQLLLVPQGDPPFLATLPPGPIFSATYTAPADGKIPVEADPSKGNADTGTTTFGVPDPSAASGATQKRLPGGSVAAAVIMPLLFVIMLGAAYYLRRTRLRQAAKRQTFAEKVDKRMSVISGDWSSTTPRGAMDAVRRSVALSATDPRMSMSANDIRASTFSFSAPVAARSSTATANPALEQYQAHLRPGVGMYQTAERVSRVSFAADTTRKSRVSFADGATRPSVDRASRFGAGTGVGRASRAFHSAFTVDTTAAYAGHDDEQPLPPAYASPSPTSVFATPRYAHGREKDDDGAGAAPGAMSPTQTAGAVPLSADDIKFGVKENGDTDVGPALRLMRTGSADGPDAELLFSPSQYNAPALPAAPAPAHTHTHTRVGASPTPPGMVSLLSPVSPSPEYTSSTPVSPQYAHHAHSPLASPVTAMSPDELLRAYAERRAAGSRGPSASPGVGGARMQMISAPMAGVGAGGRMLFNGAGAGGNGNGNGNGSASESVRLSASLYSVGSDAEGDRESFGERERR